MDSKQQQQQEWRCAECDNTGIKCKDCCLADQHDMIEKQMNLIAIANQNLDQRNKQVAEMKISLEELRSIIKQCGETASQDKVNIRHLQNLLQNKEQAVDHLNWALFSKGLVADKLKEQLYNKEQETKSLKLMMNKLADYTVKQFEGTTQMDLVASLSQPLVSAAVDDNSASSKKS